MSVFDWLLVGHLAGDWLLQSDWMAQGKRKGFFTWPGLTHFILCTIAILVAMIVAGETDREPVIYFVVVAVIFVSHWLIDATSLVDWWMSGYQQSPDFVRILIDQTLHILILALVAAVMIAG